MGLLPPSKTAGDRALWASTAHEAADDPQTLGAPAMSAQTAQNLRLAPPASGAGICGSTRRSAAPTPAVTWQHVPARR